MLGGEEPSFRVSSQASRQACCVRSVPSSMPYGGLSLYGCTASPHTLASLRLLQFGALRGLCGYLGTGAWAVVGKAGEQERKIHAAVDTLP
jgi:hypothetical protein